MVVRVDQMAAHIAVAGQMKLTHPILRHGPQVRQRVEAMIDAADVDIVDVEQDGAVGALAQPRAETPTRSSRICMEGEIARDVFQQDLPPEASCTWPTRATTAASASSV